MRPTSADPMLPSRQGYVNARDNIVPRLLLNGMVVEFNTFQGGHEIPESVQLDAFAG